jgi:hypothetical protein
MAPIQEILPPAVAVVVIDTHSARKSLLTRSAAPSEKNQSGDVFTTPERWRLKSNFSGLDTMDWLLNSDAA